MTKRHDDQAAAFRRMAEEARIRRLTAANYPDDPEMLAEQEAIARALADSQHAAQTQTNE
jgi:hypothetical protein